MNSLKLAIRKHQPRHFTVEELLRRLVAFPTVSNNYAANHAAFDFIADYLKQRGMYVQRFPATVGRQEALIASTRKDNYKTPTVLLAAHIDVIPAEESMFTMNRDGDRYLGRGVYDMKFAVASYLQIVDDLRDNLADYDFAIMLTSDEETGEKDGNGVREFVKEGYLPKVVILPDGGRDWHLETAAKGLLHYTFEANGKMAHGSRPWEGENAVLKLMTMLHELHDQFKDMGPDTDTMNIGSINGGEVANQVPDHAIARVDIRLNHPESKARYEKQIDRLCRKYDIVSTPMVTTDPIQSELNNHYVRSFADIVEETVNIKTTGVKSNGSSDVRYFAQKNVPYIVFYPFGGGHHAGDEWLDVASLEYLPTILLRYLDAVARTKV